MINTMNTDFNELQNGLTTAYIDSAYNSTLAFRPEFISNDYKQGKKVLSSIEHELSNCEEFCISVAFITEGGIKPLLQLFKDLEEKGIPGKILTTDYLTFSEPRALEQLANLSNIEIRMYHESPEDGGFHTKGYIFRKEEIYRIIIGSSNLTGKALTKNKEWNTKIVSTKKGEVAEHILYEFDELWNSVHTQKYEDFIEEYREHYLAKKLVEKQQKMACENNIVDIQSYKLKPNKMQVAFIQRLMKMREQNVRKALLISSTGTGKTYASAFALREMQPRKALFIVHREQIAKQALKSYKKVFGASKTYGLLSGSHRDIDADFLFSTMQMMAKPEIHEMFAKNEFDVIVLDECHHVGANSYQRIMSYFEPEFWLGMTASPDTTSYDIYSVFDHQIAYEIRLQQALEEDLLCPFHYFGITDLEINGEVFDDKTGVQNFNHLVSDARVDYVIEQAKYYGFSGDRVKGLIFCSRNKEAKELSVKFNQRGLRTEVLSGEDSQERRMEVIERLTTDDVTEEQLDYIFSVDIFNEGIDIPEVNQVIMLRPTESPVVFIQQLGRGLRKFDDKEYVVILDFIGNYMNNFMIPIALSGDRTYNKDTIRKYVISGNNVIPGVSTIHFDEISKKRIFSSIDDANFSDIRLIKENYFNLKHKLGHIPALLDFDRHGEMDVIRIFDNNSLGSYYKFLVKYEKDYKVRLSPSEEKVIEFVSRKLANGKRIHELELLYRMRTYTTGLMGVLRNSLKENYDISMKDACEENIVNVMTNEFPSGASKNTFKECVFIEMEDGDYRISDTFSEMLKNKDFFDILMELVEFGISRYKSNYSERYEDTDLVLYQKYTYEDACRLLNWKNNEVPLNISGYKFDRHTNTFPVFINYHKADDIQDTIKYEDHFTSATSLIAISKQSRTVESEDVQNFLKAEERGIKVELFVRKNKDDKMSKEFYYLGRMKATGRVKEFIMPNTDKTAVEIEWQLDKPVREDIYEFIVNG